MDEYHGYNPSFKLRLYDITKNIEKLSLRKKKRINTKKFFLCKKQKDLELRLFENLSLIEFTSLFVLTNP